MDFIESFNLGKFEYSLQGNQDKEESKDISMSARYPLGRDKQARNLAKLDKFQFDLDYNLCIIKSKEQTFELVKQIIN